MYIIMYVIVCWCFTGLPYGWQKYLDDEGVAYYVE